jgi:hypothetical protein
MVFRYCTYRAVSIIKSHAHATEGREGTTTNFLSQVQLEREHQSMIYRVQLRSVAARTHSCLAVTRDALSSGDFAPVHVSFVGDEEYWKSYLDYETFLHFALAHLPKKHWAEKDIEQKRLAALACSGYY